jgi:hypothetical protein
MAERLSASFVPLVFSPFGYIPDTALDFLRFVSVMGSDGIIIHTALQKILAALPRPQGPIGIP